VDPLFAHMVERQAALRSGFWWLATPVCVFLFALGVFSVLVASDSDIASSVSKSVFGGTSFVPPAQLEILDPKFERVALDNGEVVQVVTGGIVNRSPYRLKRIALEAVAFGADGEVIDVTRSQASTALAKTHIRSLTPEAISTLQAERSKVKSEIRQDAAEQFAIVLMGDEAATARYFTVRVVAAERQRS
jgi:hypothetical protein